MPSAGWRCTTGGPAPSAPRSSFRGRGRCWACRPVPRVATRSTWATPASRPRRAPPATRAAPRARVPARQEPYRSKDGPEVRLFLLHRDGLTADGARPTILYGYGGFNVSLTPAWGAGAEGGGGQGGGVACA